MTDPVREINHDQATGSSFSSVDWTAAFKSPEFCAGLQTAVAEAIAKSMGLWDRLLFRAMLQRWNNWVRLVHQFRVQPVARRARRHRL